MNTSGDKLKKHISLIKELTNKRPEGADDSAKTTTSKVRKLIALWTEAAAAATLIGGNHQVKQLGLKKAKSQSDSDRKECSSQNILNTLKAVVSTRQRLTQAQKNIDAVCEDLKNSPDAVNFSQDLGALLDLDFPSAFLSELQLEAFDDLVSDIASSHLRNLDEQAILFQKTCSEYYCSKGGQAEDDYLHSLSKDGDNYWAASFTTDSTLDEVYGSGQETILAWLPGRAMKAFVGAVEKACTVIW